MANGKGRLSDQYTKRFQLFTRGSPKVQLSESEQVQEVADEGAAECLCAPGRCNRLDVVTAPGAPSHFPIGQV